jgi:hypothetical protein
MSTFGADTVAAGSGGVRTAHASSTISLCHDFLPFCTSVLIRFILTSTRIRPGPHAGLDHGPGRTLGPGPSLHGSADRTSPSHRQHTRCRPHIRVQRRAWPADLRTLPGFGTPAPDSRRRSRQLCPSWVPYPRDLFRLPKACVSPPFLALFYRGCCHLRERHPRRPSLRVDLVAFRIPAARSTPNLARSLGLLLAAPFRHSSAWVFSSSSATNSAPADLLRRRIIWPISQPRSPAITGHLALPNRVSIALVGSGSCAVTAPFMFSVARLRPRRSRDAGPDEQLLV